MPTTFKTAAKILFAFLAGVGELLAGPLCEETAAPAVRSIQLRVETTRRAIARLKRSAAGLRMPASEGNDATATIIEFENLEPDDIVAGSDGSLWFTALR